MAAGNRFDRIRDRLAERIKLEQERVNAATAYGKPYGDVVKLNPQQKRDLYNSLDPARQQALWQQMDEAERAQITGAGTVV